MCGIAGTSGDVPGLDVEAALSRIAHRGPDGRGTVRVGDALHGHVRLALVDPTPASAQPFLPGDGSALSFVGEVWNWRALRAALEAAGRVFRTEGDTEVLAAAIASWGLPEALDRVEGMYAFAWTDPAGRTSLVRDPLGEVPLYVRRTPGGWAWASERKAFGPRAGCDPLPAGMVLDLSSGRPAGPRGEKLLDSGEDVLSCLRRGVSWRLEADVPVCCLVSGGLDSSLVLALAVASGREVVAYAAVLDPASSDLRAARRLCSDLAVPLREVPVPPPTARTLSEAVAAIEIATKAQVEIAALCLPLARRIASDGFKACLSGEAADELFGGYGSMCIKGSRADDAGWRAIRRAAVARMARGNFVRCNKAFMAAGVECRLPYCDRGLVRAVLAATKAECPPGKGLLKIAAREVLPRWVISRQKETFQGGSGMAGAAALAVADPARYYRAECARFYGPGVSG